MTRRPVAEPTPEHRPLAFKPTRGEASRLRKLLQHHEELSAAYLQPRGTRTQERLDAINANLDALAQAIGQRTLAQGLPLTLRTLRTVALGLKPVVALRFKVSTAWNDPHRFAWDADGLKLHKDGSVGFVRGYIKLDGERVWRRHLDDSWTPVLPGAAR